MSEISLSNKNCKTETKSFALKIFKSKAAIILWKIFRFFLLICLSYIILYPVIYMLSNAFKPFDEILDPSVVWVPKELTMQNIREAFLAMKYSSVFMNTLKISMVSAVLQVISCSIIGYGFARFKFKGRELLFMLVIFTILVPTQTYIIPLYLQFRFFDFFGILKLVGLITGESVTFNLLNTGMPFYLTSIFGMGLKSGLYIYVFRQFFRGMPKELEEAALIDGCGHLKTFLKVMVPNAGSSYLTVFLFAVVWQWNDYYTTSMFLNKTQTLSMSLSSLRSTLLIEGVVNDPYLVLTRLQAGSLLTILPLFLLYMFTQKYFTESVERTGIVG